MSKINAGQASSTLISEYIGSDFDAVLEVADNIEAVKVVAENVDTFGVPLASETTTGIAKIATQAEVNQKTNDSHIVTPKKLGAYAAPLVHNHTTATPTESGFLSATDKQKLDGIASNANNYTHPTSGVTAGTYNSVTVNAQGHITAGNNPTTLSGYGITDAVLSSDVATTAAANKILKLDANSKLPASITGNAATATKLTTARTINGVSFDGSANITINAVDSTSRIASSEKGVANGVATLGSDGKISSSQLPSYAGAVDSVAGKTGVVTLVKADVGLSNVDNTSDINKPISTSQQSALDLKANIASPALTGTPSAPTATVGTSTTQIATTAFVNAEIANDATPKSHVGSTGSAHGVATTSVAGFMSAADKIKLDNISGGSGVSSVNGKTGEVVLTKADVGLDLVNNTSDLDKPISTATQSALDSKYSPTNKPTAADVGLGLVNNTSDVDKPISTATQTALDAKADTNHVHGTVTTSTAGFMSAADKIKLDSMGSGGDYTHPISGVTVGTYKSVTVDVNGHVTSGTNPTTLAGYGITDAVSTASCGVANGIATLDASGLIPSTQLPSYVDDVREYANLASFPATGEAGKIYVALDTNKTYRWSGTVYVYITSGAVDSVAGKTGVVTLVKGDVGLGNVDNTSDLNKPVSTAQQTALSLKANLASPALTGTPTAPTAAAGTNTTQLATTAFVTAAVSSKVDAAHTHAIADVSGLQAALNGKQVADEDLTAIAALSGTSGLLKKTAANTWSLDTNAYITGNQSIAVSGDASGSGTTSIALTLANSGVTAGTYRSVTVDAKGRVTSGTNPTASDIGALPSGDYNPRKDAITTRNLMQGYHSNVDLDTLLAGDTGVYEANNCANSPTQAPGVFYYVETKAIYHNGGEPALLQTAQPYEGSGFFWRNFSLNTHSWSEWYKFYDSKNKPTAADVGLSNVDNTSDLDKPISTATQTALNGKANTAHTHTASDVGALSATGTAAAATKLATARTIAGKSFDGTANISITADDVGALSAAGGTISGSINVGNIIKFNSVNSLGILNSFGRTIARGTDLAVNVFGNTTDAMYFDGNSLTAWKVRYSGTLYSIYHTGNKPTPAEIGAQPATSDSRVKSNIASLPPVLDKIMLIDPKTFTMEGREGTCVGTIAQDWEVDFPEVILNVPSTSQGEPEMLKGIDALGTIGILLKAIQELKAEIEELKNR